MHTPKTESLYFKVLLEANYSVAFSQVIDFVVMLKTDRGDQEVYSSGLGLMGAAEFVLLNTVNLLLHCKGKIFLQEMVEECTP